MHRIFLLLLSFSLQATLGFAQNISTDSLTAARQVDSLLKVADGLIPKREFENALTAIKAAERLVLNKFGRESVKYAEVCDKHGWLHEWKREHPDAEKMYLDCIGAYKKAPGDNKVALAKKLSNFGNFYRELGEYAKAEPVYAEAAQVMGNAVGFDNPNYAKVLNNLAILYWRMGLFDKAESNFVAAKNIREAALGKENQDYAGSLVNLGSLYSDFGLYEKGEQSLKEARGIFLEKLKLTAHPFYMNAVNNLGALYWEMGYFEKAEPLYIEALEIAEKLNGKASPGYARSLNNLAVLYKDLGDFEKGERLMLATKDIWEKVHGVEHIEFANCLTNLGDFYLQTGNLEKAEWFLKEAQPKILKIVGKEHLNYVINLGGLARLNAESGNKYLSETLRMEALQIEEKLLGKENDHYLKSLNNLGVFYMENQNYGRSEECLNEVRSIGERTFGKLHPVCVESLQNLTRLHERKKSYTQADIFQKEYFIRAFAHLDKATTFLSEREIEKFIKIFQFQADNLNSMQLARPKIPNSSLPETAYDNVLFLKGFLQLSAVRVNKLSTEAHESTKINEQLKNARRRLAAEYAKPIAERKGVAELEEKANAAEKELARTVAGYAENTRQVKWQEVQATLENDEAAVEFIHFKVNFPKPTDSVMYAALVLKKDSPQPVFVPLFEEKQLERLLKTSGARKSDYVNKVYGTQNAGGETLYGLVWQPLDKELAGTKKVFYAPSGLLHRLKLGAIPVSESKVLSDRFQFAQVGSTRQLPEKQTLAANPGGEAALFGGIQFDMNENAIVKANAGIATRNADGTRGEPDFSKTDSTSRGGDWGYLNWTEKEVDALQPILASAGMKTALFKGFAGTEEAFKNLRSPRILHIATHGYFFPDLKNENAGKTSGEPVFKISEHPMIRSGLVLAGGNHAWKNGQPLKPDMEDGILTAYEISQMDLSNTELVVLSACETGLGDIRGNEGIYGLQRAFKIAGAKYLIMSLWQVPDFQTQELMTLFYKNYLTENMPLPEAFRAAQQEMQKKYEHPYFWAGFVLLE